MKILVITDLYPIKDSEKYTPKTIYDFVQSWEKSGHEVFVIKPNFILNSFIRKKPFFKSGTYNNILNINYWLPFCGDIKRKLNKYSDIDITQFDKIIAHMPSGLIFANKLNVPLVAGVHISDIEVLTKPLYKIYFKKELESAYKNAEKIACRSEVLKTRYLKLYPQFEDKTFVGFSGISPDIIQKRTWTKKDKYKILTCANLKKRKNIEKVVKACAELENVELTVIGDGDEMKNLKKIKAGNVNFTGHLPHEKVIQKMREADIFILPSENETFGIVYPEAMASGCITVCLRGDGIDGIIKDNENGFLTDLDNIKEVLEKIINSDNQNDILENTYLTIQNYTSEKAAEHYLKNIE